MAEKIRQFLCAIGLHKHTLRELHAEEPVVAGRAVMRMAVVERCNCGHARIAGDTMQTKTGLIVPAQYMPEPAHGGTKGGE